MSSSNDRNRDSSFDGLMPNRNGLESATVVHVRHARGCIGVK
jgi:hypothetical protein